MRPMHRQEVEAELLREPFVPFRLHVTKRRRYVVTERRAAHVLGSSLLVLIGLEPGRAKAKGFDTFAFDAIEWIEPLKPKKKSDGKRKSA